MVGLTGIQKPPSSVQDAGFGELEGECEFWFGDLVAEELERVASMIQLQYPVSISFSLPFF